MPLARGAGVSRDLTGGAFDVSSTRLVLGAACRVAGLDGAGAELLRLGENAIFRIRHEPVVVRISRHGDSCQKEVDVARWLSLHHLPAARLAEELPQLQVVDGRVITWWELIETDQRLPEFVDLARILRRLHDLPAPVSFELPTFAPMKRVLPRLDHAPAGIHADDVRFLRHLHERLQREYDALAFELGMGPIHGDAHIGNLMRDRDGTIRLIDFEVFAWGPREWDAITLGTAHRAFGWMGAAEYDRCVEIYGWDPVRWRGFRVIRAVRELNMTTWLMQRWGESRDIDGEISRRIADLRDGGDSPRRWRQF